MVGKNNFKTYFKKTANKKQRFTLKKLSVGLASVAVGATLFLGSGEAVSAQEPEEPGQETTDELPPAEDDESNEDTDKEDQTGDTGTQGGDPQGTNPAPENGGDDEEEPEENNEKGYLTPENASAAAEKALETDPVNKSYTVSQGANGRYYYLLSPNPAPENGGDDDEEPGVPEEPGEEEAVYTLYYYAQQTKGKNGATTVKAPNSDRAEVYFRNWVNENDLGDLEWSYDEDSKTFTAREKVEDPDGEEPGEEEAVYTLYYFAQRTKGKNGATTVRAKSAEEAEVYFKNFANENDLGDLEWSYDEDSKTFTAREKVEDPDGEEPGEEEAVYTLYYFAQRTKGKNGATTVRAKSAEEAEVYFKNFANENDLGDLEWSYDEDSKTFTAREKVEDPDGEEPGEEEAVYTLYYFAQRTKGKNGATTVKAKSAEEAEKYFRNWANENDLGDLDWSYDPETKTFTAREKVEEPGEPGEEEPGKPGEEEPGKPGEEEPGEEEPGKPGEEEPGKPGEEEPGEEEPGKPGEEEPGEEEPGEEKPGKPGEEKPGKPGEQKPGEQKPGEKPGKEKPGKEKPGEEKPGEKPGEQKPGEKPAAQKPGKEEKPGQTLPDTATSAWALGLLGLTSLAGGLFAQKNKED